MKKLFKKILSGLQNWNHRRRVESCVRKAAEIIAKTKLDFPLCEGARMAWPTTSATGNGNAASGQYIANGTATTILWGTNQYAPLTGWLTVTKISMKTIVAYEEQLPNGDGLTAGLVQGIDGIQTDIEVRDDTNQITSSLTVGNRIVLQDGGGLVPGGARGATYSSIITEHGWDTAPKTAAGRMLTVKKFILIS